MSTHNICFLREIRKILCGYPLLSVAMYKTLFSFQWPMFLYRSINIMLILLYKNIGHCMSLALWGGTLPELSCRMFPKIVWG